MPELGGKKGWDHYLIKECLQTFSMFQCSPFKLNRLLPDHNVIATSDTFMEAEETFLVYNWVTCNHNNQINQVNVYTVMQSKYNAWHCVLFAAVNHFPPVLQLLQQFFGSIVTVALLIQCHAWSCTIGTLTLIILLVFTFSEQKMIFKVG